MTRAPQDDGEPAGQTPNLPDGQLLAGGTTPHGPPRVPTGAGAAAVEAMTASPFQQASPPTSSAGDGSPQRSTLMPLPSMALLSGASSISVASPFLQQQLSANPSGGSAVWRSSAGEWSESSAGNTPLQHRARSPSGAGDSPARMHHLATVAEQPAAGAAEGQTVPAPTQGQTVPAPTPVARAATPAHPSSRHPQQQQQQHPQQQGSPSGRAGAVPGRPPRHAAARLARPPRQAPAVLSGSPHPPEQHAAQHHLPHIARSQAPAPVGGRLPDVTTPPAAEGPATAAPVPFVAPGLASAPWQAGVQVPPAPWAPSATAQLEQQQAVPAYLALEQAAESSPELAGWEASASAVPPFPVTQHQQQPSQLWGVPQATPADPAAWSLLQAQQQLLQQYHQQPAAGLLPLPAAALVPTAAPAAFHSGAAAQPIPAPPPIAAAAAPVAAAPGAPLASVLAPAVPSMQTHDLIRALLAAAQQEQVALAQLQHHQAPVHQTPLTVTHANLGAAALQPAVGAFGFGLPFASAPLPPASATIARSAAGEAAAVPAAVGPAAPAPASTSAAPQQPRREAARQLTAAQHLVQVAAMAAMGDGTGASLGSPQPAPATARRTAGRGSPSLQSPRTSLEREASLPPGIPAATVTWPPSSDASMSRHPALAALGREQRQRSSSAAGPATPRFGLQRQSSLPPLSRHPSLHASGRPPIYPPPLDLVASYSGGRLSDELAREAAGAITPRLREGRGQHLPRHSSLPVLPHGSPSSPLSRRPSGEDVQLPAWFGQAAYSVATTPEESRRGSEESGALQLAPLQLAPQQGPGLGRSAAASQSVFAALAAPHHHHHAHQQRPRIKLLLTSGGSFVQPGVAWDSNVSASRSGGAASRRPAASDAAAEPKTAPDYAGGETRLVSVHEDCSLAELLAAVAKTDPCRTPTPSTGRGSGRGSAVSPSSSSLSALGAASQPHSPHILRYRLPSEPSVLVDVVDSEDVRLMFEEWTEWRLAEGGTTPRKLHLYVQWLVPAQHFSAESETAHLPASAFSVAQGLVTGSEEGSEGTPRLDHHPAHASAADLRLAEIRSDHLEIIPGEDVILLAHLGTGTFGEMYRGRWRECNVGVKCLDPAMVGLVYSSRQAWIDFVADANKMGALRHPNLVEVYGVVLPHDSDPRLALGHSRSDPACLQHQDKQQQAQGLLAGPATPAAGGAPLRRLPTATPDVGGVPPQPLPGPVARPPALVMEYVSGRSLGGALLRRDDIVAGKLVRVVYALETAKAMEYLHSKHIVHYDLKPGNILLGWRDRRPTAKVAGYGLTMRKTSVKLGAIGWLRSMLPYCAPELLRTGDAGSPCDVFSFGVVLWQLWSMAQPYAGVPDDELRSRLLASHGEERPPLPGEGGQPAAEEPGPGWRDLVQECWAQLPEQRPSFAVVVERLREIAQEVRQRQQALPTAPRQAPQRGTAATQASGINQPPGPAAEQSEDASSSSGSGGTEDGRGR